MTRATTAVVSTVLLAGTATVVAAAPASAATTVTAYQGSYALKHAASRIGMQYLYGAAGPTRFDCSGLTQWSYRYVGRALPRTAQQQYDATLHIGASYRRAGDLVFFMNSSGAVYHVGIYADSGKIWHSPKAGDHVRLATIWTTSVAYGRVK